MSGRFKPLTPLRGWRRVAAHAWRPPQDPSVYALVDVRMHKALPYLDRVRERTGVHVTVSHLVAKGIALAIHQYPQLNGIVAREMDARVAQLRARRDKQVERTKSMLDRMPLSLLGPVLRGIAYLTYDLDLDLTRFGVVRDSFGTFMVTNVGMFGLSAAFAPLVPFSRTPLVALVGEVQERAVVEAGRVVARPMMTLGVTFDHRFMDGFQGGAMAQIFRAYVEDPEQFEEPASAPAVTATARPSPQS